jgi:hypothetical protein
VGYIGQAHLRTTLRPLHLTLAVLMGTLIVSLLAVSAALASDVTVSNCAKLQPILNEAEAGEVITLAALCTKSNSGKAEGVFRLPSNVADITIEGQSGMTAGFEGMGVKGHALEGNGNGLVLRNLVVEHYSLKEKSAVSLTPTEGALPKFEADRFLDDTDSTSNSSAHGGALYVSASNATCAYTAPLSISGSEFDGDQISDTATNELSDVGGGVSAEIRCTSASTTPVDFATLTADRFLGDSIDTAKGREVFGGALYLANRSSAGVLVSATQSGNVFEEDAIVSTTPTKVYGGGGEWASSIVLTSTDDRFVKDALPGPQSSSASSEGAGLGMISPNCTEAATASAVLNDAVLAANAIGTASEGGESEGAGIFAACEPTHPNSPFHLTLNNSTVAENQAPKGISGVDGEESDQLTLSNSIVTSPPGQADIGGFQPVSGGSLTSLFSDACKPDTSAVLPGEGNTCANPLLVDNGDPSSGDVRETYVSPTIDAGSNALVPGGLTMDAFDAARILPGHLGCGGGSATVVDMGASEFVVSAPPCPAQISPISSGPAPGLTHFVSLKTGSTAAALRLSCSSTDGLGCSGTIFVTSDETLQGKKVLAVTASRSVLPVRIAQASFSLTSGSTATIQLKLNSTGLELLHRFHAISAFVVANEASPTSTPFIFLFHTTRFIQPGKHKSKKHKPRHSKHSKRH